MTATIPLYARPESFRGEQCAEAPAERRHVTLQLSGRGGGQALGNVPSAELSRLLIAPGGVCPAELPDGTPAVGASSQLSGCQDACHAVRRRPRPPVGVHPSVSSSGVQVSSRPVSSPSGVRTSGSLIPDSAVRPSGVQSSGVQPVRRPAVWCPSVRPSHPSGPASARRWRLGTPRYGGATFTTGTSRVPWSGPVTQAYSVDSPSRPGCGQRCGGRV